MSTQYSRLKDLLPQVQAAFAQYQSADKAKMEKHLVGAVLQTATTISI